MALKQANMPGLVLCYFALHQWCRKMIQDVTHRRQDPENLVLHNTFVACSLNSGLTKQGMKHLEKGVRRWSCSCAYPFCLTGKPIKHPYISKVFSHAVRDVKQLLRYLIPGCYVFIKHLFCPCCLLGLVRLMVGQPRSCGRQKVERRAHGTCQRRWLLTQRNPAYVYLTAMSQIVISGNCPFKLVPQISPCSPDVDACYDSGCAICLSHSCICHWGLCCLALICFPSHL